MFMKKKVLRAFMVFHAENQTIDIKPVSRTARDGSGRKGISENEGDSEKVYENKGQKNTLASIGQNVIEKSATYRKRLRECY